MIFTIVIILLVGIALGFTAMMVFPNIPKTTIALSILAICMISIIGLVILIVWSADQLPPDARYIDKSEVSDKE